MPWLGLFNRRWVRRAPFKVYDGHGNMLRAWAIDQEGHLHLFEGCYSEPYKQVRYKNLSHWKNTLGKILAVVKDKGLNCDRLEFLVDAPMAERLYRTGVLRLDHLMSCYRAASSGELLLPTDGRMSSTLKPSTQYLVIDWELIGVPVTLVIAAGAFDNEKHVCFRVAQTMRSTIYGIRSPNRVNELIGHDGLIRQRNITPREAAS